MGEGSLHPHPKGWGIRDPPRSLCIKSISCQRAGYQSYSALSCITQRQRDVLIEAKKAGYYDYPRHINADQLSERLGIGKSATIEHLRKAEGRIISHVLSGY